MGGLGVQGHSQIENGYMRPTSKKQKQTKKNVLECCVAQD